MSTPEEISQKLEKQLQEGFGTLQKKYDGVIDTLEKGDKATTEMKTDISNAKGELQKIIDKVQELEEKGVRLRGKGGPEQKSFLDFIKSDSDYKAMSEKKQPAAEIEFTKGDLSGMMETKVTSAGLIVPHVDPVIQAAPRQELRIRDLIPEITISSPLFWYFRELLHTRGAAIVAEGAAKPSSNVTFEKKEDSAKKVAVWMPVTDEAVMDIPQLQSYIRELLRYDLKLAGEGQILKGSGTGNNMNGLMTQATSFDAGLSKAGDTPIDTVRRAIYQVRKQAKRGADGVVMTDLDWMNIELQKDGENRYLFANLQGLVTPILWGRPVVVSDSMDEGDEDTGGEFLVGAFQASARIYALMSLLVKLGWINDDFVKNQHVVLVEERFGLGVPRPYGLVKGNFPAVEA